MADPELESFKTAIDLRAYAASQGYVLDRKESWRGAAVMRHVNGDKVIIKRGGDGHYVYFSVRDDADHGTIIDFVQNRLRLTFGAVRKELRPWVGQQAATHVYDPLPATSKNRTRVETAYSGMQDAARHPFLEYERGIPPSLLQGERFIGKIRTDQRGNAVFPHFDREGLCGFELKNAGFTGFAPGGVKGLWLSQVRPDDNRLVFCEAAIDALSYALLFPDDKTRFASIGGQLSPAQRELMRVAAASMPMQASIVAAMDADNEGKKLADIVRQAVTLTGRDDLEFILHEPDGYKDWNDQLRKKSRQRFLRQHQEPAVR